MAVLPIIKVIVLIAFVHGGLPVWMDRFQTTLRNCDQIIKKANRFNSTHPGVDKIFVRCKFLNSQIV